MKSPGFARSSVSPESRVKLPISTGVDEERVSETTEDVAMPLSICTALEVVGTPPVQILAVVQTPVPTFHTEVWPKAGAAMAARPTNAMQAARNTPSVL